MKISKNFAIFLLFPAAVPCVENSPNGISFPADYKDWRVISTIHRTDSETLRVIIGNDVAINALRQGKTRPWPDGAMIAKVAWRIKHRADWQIAIVPDKFVDIGFMIKESKKFAATGGWGFAQWAGRKLMPYGDDADFTRECFGCHTLAKDNDYVFVEPAIMP
ncbi:Cytochrome P460 [Gammaproteobacteria bacterium]